MQTDSAELNETGIQTELIETNESEIKIGILPTIEVVEALNIT